MDERARKKFSGGVLRVLTIYHKWFIKLETGKISQTVLQKLTRKLSNERSSKGQMTDPLVPVFIYAVLLPIPETVPRLTPPLMERKPFSLI